MNNIHEKIYKVNQALDSIDSIVQAIGYKDQGQNNLKIKETTDESQFNKQIKDMTLQDSSSGQMIDVNNPPLPLVGAKGDGITDDTVAIRNIISYAVNNSCKLYFPSKKYLISSTLDFNQLVVTGNGTQWQSGRGTQFITNTDGILMAKANNEASIKNIVFNGNGHALWGLMLSGARTTIESVAIVRCTEYGLVLNALQNACLINVNTRFNNYGLVLANGTRNCNFYNFTSSIENGFGYDNNTANSRNILFLIDTNNPHGFGLTSSVTQMGNDRNNFFGGISETFNSISGYVVETKNISNFANINAGVNNFFGYEFTGNSIFNFDNTFTGTFNLHDCAFITSTQTSPLTNGTSGGIYFYGNSFFSGSGNLANRGITCSNNYRKLCTFNSNDYTRPTGYNLTGGTLTFNPTTKVYSISNGPGNGVQGIQIAPIDNNINQIPAIITEMKPLIRLTFTLTNITGGSGEVKLYASLTKSPWRNFVQSFGNGTFSISYKCQGNESGFEFAFGTTTSFDISNITIEIM